MGVWRAVFLVVLFPGAGVASPADTATPQATFERGVESLKAGRLEEAEAAFRRLLQQGTREPYVHNNLGIVYQQQGRHREAVAECREAIRLDAAYPAPRVVMGGSLLALGRVAEAVTTLEAAVKLLPKERLAREQLARRTSARGGRPRPSSSTGPCASSPPPIPSPLTSSAAPTFGSRNGRCSACGTSTPARRGSTRRWATTIACRAAPTWPCAPSSAPRRPTRRCRRSISPWPRSTPSRRTGPPPVEIDREAIVPERGRARALQLRIEAEEAVTRAAVVALAAGLGLSAGGAAQDPSARPLA